MFLTPHYKKKIKTLFQTDIYIWITINGTHIYNISMSIFLLNKIS